MRMRQANCPVGARTVDSVAKAQGIYMKSVALIMPKSVSKDPVVTVNNMKP